MKNIDYFFDLLKQSDITLLEYSFKDERIKDEIISKLPNVEIDKIDSSFSFISHIRDLKINHILNNSEISNNIDSKLLVIDLNNIYKSSSLSDKRYYLTTKRIIGSLRNEMYKISNPHFKLLLTASMYRDKLNQNGDEILNFSGGTTPVYISDVCCVIKENIIKVLKNRFGSNDIKISIDGLKDYNYICDYENN